MTAAALSPSIEYLENGVTLAFAVPFRFLDASHLQVKRIASNGTVTVLAQGSAWSATGGTTDAGGTVTLVASVATARLKIRRVTPRAQPTDYATNDTFPAESHEAALDRLTLIAQEADVATADLAARALAVPEGETIAALGNVAARASKVFAFGAAGEFAPISLLFPTEGPKVGDMAVTLEQFGGGPLVLNNTTAIQTAIAFCVASGISEIRLGLGTYGYRTAARTSDPGVYDTQLDGFALRVPAGLHLRITGTGRDKTILKQLSVNGNSNNTDWQVVSGKVWRGNGILIEGLAAAPAARALAGGVTLRDLTFDGGVAYGASATAGQAGATYPANTATGQGWDITHKAIAAQADKYTDHIRLYNARLTGWGGECTYQGGTDKHIELTILDSFIDETNGDAINPCCELVDIRGLVISRAFQAMEGWTGRAGGFIQLSAYNCFTAGPMQGGKPGAGTYSTYYAPTRYADGLLPLGTVHLTLVKCGAQYTGSFLTGTIDVVDGTASVGEVAVFADGVRDTDLEFSLTCDTINVVTALTISGGNVAGVQLTDTLRLRVTCGRTKEAQAAGRVITYPIRWTGSLGPDIYIEAGILDAASPPQQSASIPAYPPAFVSMVAPGTSVGLATWNVETTPTIIPQGPVIYLTSTAASGAFAGTLSETNAQPGQILELRNSSATKAFAITSSSNGAVGREAVIPPFFTAHYRYSPQGFWLLIDAPPVLKGTATIDIPAMAINAVSAEQTITVLGARVGMPATVAATAAISANVEVIGVYVSAVDTVKFRLRDVTGAGYDPANAVYSATVGNFS